MKRQTIGIALLAAGITCFGGISISGEEPPSTSTNDLWSPPLEAVLPLFLDEDMIPDVWMQKKMEAGIPPVCTCGGCHVRSCVECHNEKLEVSHG